MTAPIRPDPFASLDAPAPDPFASLDRPTPPAAPAPTTNQEVGAGPLIGGIEHTLGAINPWQDELTGAVNALPSLVTGHFHDAAQTYQQERDASRERQAAYAAAHPVSSKIQDVLGMILPALATGGMSTEASAGRMALTRGQAAIQGFKAAAPWAAGYSLGAAQGTPVQQGVQTAAGAGLGGLVGAGAGAGTNWLGGWLSRRAGATPDMAREFQFQGTPPEAAAARGASVSPEVAAATPAAVSAGAPLAGGLRAGMRADPTLARIAEQQIMGLRRLKNQIGDRLQSYVVTPQAVPSASNGPVTPGDVSNFDRRALPVAVRDQTGRVWTGHDFGQTGTTNADGITHNDLFTRSKARGATFTPKEITDRGWITGSGHFANVGDFTDAMVQHDLVPAPEPTIPAFDSAHPLSQFIQDNLGTNRVFGQRVQQAADAVAQRGRPVGPTPVEFKTVGEALAAGQSPADVVAASPLQASGLNPERLSSAITQNPVFADLPVTGLSGTVQRPYTLEFVRELSHLSQQQTKHSVSQALGNTAKSVLPESEANQMVSAVSDLADRAHPDYAALKQQYGEAARAQKTLADMTGAALGPDGQYHIATGAESPNPLSTIEARTAAGAMLPGTSPRYTAMSGIMSALRGQSANAVAKRAAALTKGLIRTGDAGQDWLHAIGAITPPTAAPRAGRAAGIAVGRFVPSLWQRLMPPSP